MAHNDIFRSAAVFISTKKTPGPEITCSFTKSTSNNQDPAPIISVPAQRRFSANGFSTSLKEECSEKEAAAPSFTDQPIFFRSVSNNLMIPFVNNTELFVYVC